MSKKQPRVSVPWSGARRRGGEILTIAKSLSPAVKGPNVAQLCEDIERICGEPLSLSARDADDIVPADAVGQVEVEIAAMIPGMLQLLKASPGLDQQHPKPGPNVSVMPAWRASIDIPYMAAERALGQCSPVEVSALAEAHRLLIGLKAKPIARATGGLPPVKDTLHFIARAVVAYRIEHGLTCDSDWKTAPEFGRVPGSPHTDEECIPKSQTAMLLRGMVDAFGFEARNVTLRNILERYLGKLNLANRAPTPNDVLNISWD